MKTLKLLFTSDEHGHIRKAPHLQSLINKEKAENPNVLLLSSGDVFQGTAESDLQGGKPSLDVVDKAGYDLVELGNHDFDNGLPFVKEWLKQAKYPILAGNVLEEETGQRLPGAKAYEVFEMDGVKVGLIGVVAPETAITANPENIKGLRFEEPAPVVLEARKELEEQGVEVIGVVSHLGLPDDEKLAAQVKGLDFILGGHTHKALHQPKVVGETLICQPGSFRDYLGSLELEVDEETGQIASYRHELIPTDEGQDLGGAVSQSVRAATERLSSATAQGVTESKSELNHDHFRDNTLGQQLSDAMRAVTGAPVALYNRKAERADLKAGEVSAGEIHASLPFPNEVVKIEIPRQDLLRTIERSDMYADHRSLIHQYLAVDYKPTPDGHLQVTDLYLTLDPGEPEETVEVATTDYLAGGGLGYFDNAKIVSRHGLLRDVLEVGLDEQLPPDNPLRQPGNSAQEVFSKLKGD